MKDEKGNLIPNSELLAPNSQLPPRRLHPSTFILHPFVGYALLLLVLFHRLFLGEVLEAGADLYVQPPFSSVAPADFKLYTNTIQGDAWRQHGAWQQFQYEAARQGRFPLWNPYEYLGMPFHGNGQTALLHPFSWAYYFFDPPLARGPVACFRLWVSASAMYLLLRRWGLGRGAAFLGGACWMFAPFNIRWLHWPLANSSLWLPILALALDRLLQAEGRGPVLRALVVASLAAVGLQLCGHPETQFQAGVAAGITVLVRLCSLAFPLRRSAARVGLCLIAMLLGTIGAVAQLLPFLMQLPDSADWVKHFHASSVGLDPGALLLLLCHTFWGQTRADGVYEGPANYIEVGTGVGLIPLALALAALAAAFRPTPFLAPHRRAVFGLWISVFLLFAFIFNLPVVSDLLVRVPLFDQAARARWLLATQLWLSLLAGFGADLVARRYRAGGLRAAAVLILLTFALAVLLTQRVPARFSKIRTAFRQEHWREVVQHPAIRASAALACAAGASVWLLRRSRNPASSALMGLCVWTSLEGLAGAWDFNATAPRDLADPKPPPLLQQAIVLAGDGRLVGTEEVLYPNTSVKYHFRDVSGYDWPLPLRLERALSAMGWHVVAGTSLSNKAFFPRPSPALAAFLSRCSVRVVFSDDRRTPERPGDWPQLAVGPGRDAIYLNPDAQPRVRWATAPKVGDAEESFVALTSPDRGRPSVVEPSAEDPASIQAGAGEASIVDERAPERIEIAVRAVRPGVLILADRMAPGWSVTIDGATKPALTVDYLFRGVVVPEGNHAVVWTYQAPGFYEGVWISAGVGVTLLAMVAVSFLPRAVGRESMIERTKP